MANYFHDEQVTWQKMHKQWKSQQNKMRSKVKIEDMFDWEVPKHVSIKYEKNKDFGLIKVKRNMSLRRLNKWKAKNDLKNTNNDNKTGENTSNKVPLRYIGGVDISATKPGAFEYDKACAGLMIYEYPSMKLIHEETEIVTLKHPYIAGFLAFREVSHLIKLVNKVKKQRPDIVPQVILVDGNGILHYRRLGLATHLSMRVNIPCIGIAKKLLAIDNLNVDYLVPHLTQKLNIVGRFYKIYGFNKEQVGYAVRTRRNDDIVYVSPGHMIDYETSLKIVMVCLDSDGRYKLPLPVEKADFVSRKEIYRYQQQHRNAYSYNNHDHNDDYKQGYNDNYRRNNRNFILNTNTNSARYTKNVRKYQSKRMDDDNDKKEQRKCQQNGTKNQKKLEKPKPKNQQTWAPRNKSKKINDAPTGTLSKSAKRRNRKNKQWKKVTLND